MYKSIYEAKKATVAAKLDKAAAFKAAHEAFAKAGEAPQNTEAEKAAFEAEKAAFKRAGEAYREAKKAAEKAVSRKVLAEAVNFDSYSEAAQTFLFALDALAALIAREAAAVTENGFYTVSKADKKTFAAVTDSLVTVTRLMGLKKEEIITSFLTTETGKGRPCAESARDILNIFRPCFSTRYDDRTGALLSFIDISPEKRDTEGKLEKKAKVKKTPVGRFEAVLIQFVDGKNGYGIAFKDSDLGEANKAYTELLEAEAAAEAEKAAAEEAKADLAPETEETIEE